MSLVTQRWQHVPLHPTQPSSSWGHSSGQKRAAQDKSPIELLEEVSQQVALQGLYRLEKWDTNALLSAPAPHLIDEKPSPITSKRRWGGRRGGTGERNGGRGGLKGGICCR